MMTLSPAEIRAHEFRKTFRGLDSRNVRAFLDSVAQGIDELQKENDVLRRNFRELELKFREYQSLEQSRQQTLLQAQEIGGKALENARKESQLIIQESEQRASLITDKARNELLNLREQITILRAKKDSMISRMKMLLNSELDVIKALEVEERLRDNEQLSFELSKEKIEIEEIIKNLG